MNSWSSAPNAVKARVSQKQVHNYDAVCFILLLYTSAFVSGNEIADQKFHIIVVCIYIAFGHAHYFL